MCCFTELSTTTTMTDKTNEQYSKYYVRRAQWTTRPIRTKQSWHVPPNTCRGTVTVFRDTSYVEEEENEEGILLYVIRKHNHSLCINAMCDFSFNQNVVHLDLARLKCPLQPLSPSICKYRTQHCIRGVPCSTVVALCLVLDTLYSWYYSFFSHPACQKVKMFPWRWLALLALIPLALSANAGVKVKLTQKGLEFGGL